MLLRHNNNWQEVLDYFADPNTIQQMNQLGIEARLYDTYQIVQIRFRDQAVQENFFKSVHFIKKKAQTKSELLN